EDEFEVWRAVERERLNALTVKALTNLVDRQALGAPDTAIETARRLLAIDPSQEPVYRTLMRVLVRQGHRAAALKQYELCVDWFERDLGVEPEKETQQLYRDILRGANLGPDRLQGASSSRRHVSVRAEETPMVGRGLESGYLNDALTKMLDVGGRVVLVRGE